MHTLEEWRIRDVEQKAEQAHSRLHELDSLRSDVGTLEHSNRGIRAQVDGLRDALETAVEQIRHLESLVDELQRKADGG